MCIILNMGDTDPRRVVIAAPGGDPIPVWRLIGADTAHAILSGDRAVRISVTCARNWLRAWGMIAPR